MEIKIGQFAYTVVEDDLQDADGQKGCTYAQLGQIRISPYLSQSQRRATLLHEALHGCADFAGFVDDKIKYTEEEFVTRLSPILLTMMAENPELMKELCEAQQ